MRKSRYLYSKLVLNSAPLPRLSPKTEFHHQPLLITEGTQIALQRLQICKMKCVNDIRGQEQKLTLLFILYGTLLVIWSESQKSHALRFVPQSFSCSPHLNAYPVFSALILSLSKPKGSIGLPPRLQARA